MKRGRVQALILALLLVLSVPAWAADTWQLTILHTNDFHGMMMAHDYGTESSFIQGDLGGLARRATAIKRLRQEIEHAVVVVDAGDFFTRGPWHTKWFGEPEIEAMNLMGYDVFCVGNNELKAIWEDRKSKDIMLGLMRRSRFPWLAANLTLSDCPPSRHEDTPFVEGIHPFVVRRLDGIRVGFLGLTAIRSADYPHLKGWIVSDPIEAARRWVPKARTECDVLIAVTHIGLDPDKRLAAEVPGIDAIVGGDSHTFLEKPMMVENPSGRKVPVAQAGGHGVVLGRLDLTFERTDAWRLTAAEGTLIALDTTFAEDADIEAFLRPYLAPLDMGARPARVPSSTNAHSEALLAALSAGSGQSLKRPPAPVRRP